MKSLSGRDLAGFVKERQAHQVASLEHQPKLLIIRDSDNPVITKYVNLKIRYGEDIGIAVEDYRPHRAHRFACMDEYPRRGGRGRDADLHPHAHHQRRGSR